MTSRLLVFLLLLCSPALARECGPHFMSIGDRCVPAAALRVDPQHHELSRGVALPPGVPTITDSPAAPTLKPFRAYLNGASIPPPGVGAYGIVAAHGKATAPERARFTMLCHAFLAYLAPQPGPDSPTPIADQMLTVWPLDQPTAPEAQADQCDYLLDHYDVAAADDAFRDATRQGGQFSGDGPFLIGWSPATTRGVPDKLVMVIDMSGYDTQERFNYGFQFWKSNIIDHPELFRRGWNLEGVRQSIRDFSDHYGTDILTAAHLSAGAEKH